MAPGQLHMYCREATEDYKQSQAMLGYPDVQMYPKSTIGKGPLENLIKEGAAKLGLGKDFCAHSLRSACITKLTNNPSISLAETMRVACYTSVSASKTYQRVDGVSEGNRLCALGLLKDGGGSEASVCSLVASSESDPRKNSIVELDDDGKPIVSDDSVSLPEVSTPHTPYATIPLTQVGIDELKGKISELKGMMVDSKPKKLSMPCNPYVKTPMIPLTQVGIDELKGEITELKGMMVDSKPRKPSPNQKAIMKLCEVVANLKKELANREHNILYFRSIDHDRDMRVENLHDQNAELEREIVKLKMENEVFQRYIFQDKCRGRF